MRIEQPPAPKRVVRPKRETPHRFKRVYLRVRIQYSLIRIYMPRLVMATKETKGDGWEYSAARMDSIDSVKMMVEDSEPNRRRQRHTGLDSGSPPHSKRRTTGRGLS